MRVCVCVLVHEWCVCVCVCVCVTHLCVCVCVCVCVYQNVFLKKCLSFLWQSPRSSIGLCSGPTPRRPRVLACRFCGLSSSEPASLSSPPLCTGVDRAAPLAPVSLASAARARGGWRVRARAALGSAADCTWLPAASLRLATWAPLRLVRRGLQDVLGQWRLQSGYGVFPVDLPAAHKRARLSLVLYAQDPGSMRWFPYRPHYYPSTTDAPLRW